MKVWLLTLIISVVIPSLAYEQPTCRAHEGTVLSFCNGSPFRKWGVGPEGEEQAIANCQWAANGQECIRNTTVVLDPFTLRSIGRGANATIDRMQWFGGTFRVLVPIPAPRIGIFCRKIVLRLPKMSHRSSSRACDACSGGTLDWPRATAGSGNQELSLATLPGACYTAAARRLF